MSKVTSLIKAYQRMDPAARNSWEVLLLYPEIKAIFFTASRMHSIVTKSLSCLA